MGNVINPYFLSIMKSTIPISCMSEFFIQFEKLYSFKFRGTHNYTQSFETVC